MIELSSTQCVFHDYKLVKNHNNMVFNTTEK